jgi:starch synthase
MPALSSVLFVASECAPFAHVGGVGDVVAALPRALHRAGHDARVLIPLYGTVPRDGLAQHPAALGVPMGNGEAWCAVHETRLPGSDVPVYLLEHQRYFGRRYVYTAPGGVAPRDGAERFACLSRAALQLCKHLQWYPDVLHAHDWPTALVPVYHNAFESRAGALDRTASVLTIHNLAHQGVLDRADYPPLGLPSELLREDALGAGPEVNVMKGGLLNATMLTTVSPRYAREIRTPEGGSGLQSVVDFRGADLVGILNGIDDDIWDPARDPRLIARFDGDNLDGKARCKEALQNEMRLARRDDVPLIGMITRLTYQKGSDVVERALDRLLALDTQIVMLGAGDSDLEEQLRLRSLLGGGRFRMNIGYDDGLSHRIEAGCDMFLMPSRFEPCGLNQMYSQRYGALPIVRATGGLDDTVEAYDPESGSGTGFKFSDLSVDALVATVAFAVETYRQRPDAWRAMQRRAMQKRMGWQIAAERYAAVYRWARERGRR